MTIKTHSTITNNHYQVICPSSGKVLNCKNYKTASKLNKNLEKQYVESLEASKTHHQKVAQRKATREAELAKKH